MPEDLSHEIDVFEGPHARQVEIFLSLYFAMTGLHALHMIIGIGVMLVILVMAWRGRFLVVGFAAGNSPGRATSPVTYLSLPVYSCR